MSYFTNLEKIRMQERILYNLKTAFESSEEIGSSHFAEAMDELDLLKEDYLTEVSPESVLQDLSDLAQAKEIKSGETGEPISMIEYQDMIFQKVDMLADILGVELEE